MTDQAPAPIGHNKAPARKVRQFWHTCPECGERFTAASEARFCSDAHKNAFHNRSAKRGKVAMPLLLAWRMGRGGGDAAKYAFAELCALADKWNAEDRKEGRAPMSAFIAPKMQSGWKAADL